jgi:flagellar biosynthetic protein FliQ
MEMAQALDLGRQALWITLVLSAPILLVGLVVGLVVSIVQTVTQIQDQTVSLVPKIVAMFAAAAFFVPWLAQRVIEYSQAMFAGR